MALLYFGQLVDGSSEYSCLKPILTAPFEAWMARAASVASEPGLLHELDNGDVLKKAAGPPASS